MKTRKNLDAQWNDFIQGSGPAPRTNVAPQATTKGETRADRRAKLTPEQRAFGKLCAENKAKSDAILAEINARMAAEMEDRDAEERYGLAAAA